VISQARKKLFAEFNYMQNAIDDSEFQKQGVKMADSKWYTQAKKRCSTLPDPS